MSAATGATFFGEDYELYRDLLSSQCQGVAVLGAYCLMPHPISNKDVPLRAALRHR